MLLITDKLDNFGWDNVLCTLIVYTKDNIKQAFQNKTSDFKKYKAISLFFDIYAEDPINAMTDAQSANFLTKIGTTRNMFYPLRKTDELINDEIVFVSV